MTQTQSVDTDNSQEASMTTVLDTPAQINTWRYLSAVSQLTSEVRTGLNWYGKTSVYSGIRGQFIPADMIPARATRKNKILALAMLCYDQPAGRVIDSARALLAQIEATEGIAVIIAE